MTGSYGPGSSKRPRSMQPLDETDAVIVWVIVIVSMSWGLATILDHWPRKPPKPPKLQSGRHRKVGDDSHRLHHSDPRGQPLGSDAVGVVHQQHVGVLPEAQKVVGVR